MMHIAYHILLMNELGDKTIATIRIADEVWVPMNKGDTTLNTGDA